MRLLAEGCAVSRAVETGRGVQRIVPRCANGGVSALAGGTAVEFTPHCSIPIDRVVVAWAQMGARARA